MINLSLYHKTSLMKKTFLLLILFSGITFAQALPGWWSQKTSLPVTGRFGSAAFVIGNSAYAGCGGTLTTQNQELWEYNTATDTWTQRANFPGAVRLGCAAFTINGKGYMGMGSNLATFYNDFYEYDPVANTWTPKANYPGTGSLMNAFFAIGNYGYAGLGEDATSSSPTDFYRYDPIRIRTEHMKNEKGAVDAPFCT